MNYYRFLIPWFIVIFLTLISCSQRSDKSGSESSKVELRKTGDSYRLFVNDEEFYVKGAGCESGDIEALAAHGANSLRTWRVDNDVLTGKELLDHAWENGLMVMIGIEIGSERHGFDYNNNEWVADQKERVRKEVYEIKDHPALLGWGIGNELNLHYTNMKVWDAVNDIAKMINTIDGNHPTTTMLAGIDKVEVDYIKENCKDIDFLSIQLYGEIENLHQIIDEAGYQGPYLVTEWGATGHWEVAVTEWGAPIEQTSSEKAAAIKYRYENVIAEDSLNCLGSYVFLWGQKQERTPTWYGLFTEDNREMEPIDVMHFLWNNKWPENKTPRIISADIEGCGRFENIKLLPGKEYSASVAFHDPENDPVNIIVEIMPEATEVGSGGDYEPKPPTVKVGIKTASSGDISFLSPDEAGPYRLFIYVNDDDNNTGTVNIPFMVSDRN